MDKTKEILKDQFKKLPKDIQDAILAVDLRSKMQLITKKNNLHIDQAEALEKEVVFVLLGLEHPSNLIANIAKHVEVSEEKAEVITEDLNREIFLKVRESLKKIFEDRDEEESSFLGGSLLGKTKDEDLNREDILREIEDKEHHNPPIVSATELHLEVLPPSELLVKQPDEIMIPTETTRMETKRPSEVSFPKSVTEKPQMKKLAEIIIPAEQAQKKDLALQTGVHLEAKLPSSNNIIKDKMSGIVNIPKETVVINDSVSPTKANSTKVDPYREQVGK